MPGTFHFEPGQRLIRLRVKLRGPWGEAAPWFALDTGATRTVIAERTVRALGIDTSILPRPFRVAAATQTTPAGEVTLQSLSVLGKTWDEPKLIFYPLNPSTRVEGLLGLDFFRDRILKIDFQRGRIELNSPRQWWPFR